MTLIFNSIFDPTSALRPRVIALSATLVLVNIAVWVWALLLFHNSSLLLGSAILAYALGLRHAVDPDHIAAIDNVTRKLLHEGQRPVSIGLWFALGHSTLVVVAATMIAITTTQLQGAYSAYKDIGAVISTSASASFLLLIAVFNLMVLKHVWRSYRQMKATGHYDEEDLNVFLNKGGVLARLLRPLFKLVSRSWHMYPVGLLFALGFDTATEIGVFGLSAAEASKGVSLWAILIFPALFTAGMTLVDSADGMMMVGAYGWAFIDPVRKLFYNITITSVSVVVAVFIGGVEALGLINTTFKFDGWFWDAVGALSARFDILGYVIVGLFVLAWGASFAAFKFGRFHEIEVAGE